MNKSIWYSLQKILSYNALFNFIVGARGGGKTYASKQLAINSFLKDKSEFVYIRRYKTEMKRSRPNFFNDISNAYPDVAFTVKGNKAYINDEIAGHFITLSNAKIEKSVSYPNVKYIIFDEFILDKGHHHYLPDEVTAFLELYETVARLREVKVIFISNAVSINNPYFIYFGIDTPYQKSIEKYYNVEGSYTHINKDKKQYPDIAVEFYENEEFIEVKNKTRFGGLIKGTKYGDYAVNNKMLRDSNSFIEKKPQSRYIYTINIEGMDIGVWFDNGMFYISNDLGSNNNKFIFDVDNHDPSYLLIDKSDFIHKRLKNAFKNSHVFFEDSKTKALFYNIIK